MDDKEKDILTNFLYDNLDPIIRISCSGKVLFANSKGKDFLKRWDTEYGDILPEFWKRKIKNVLDLQSQKKLEISIEKNIFSIKILPDLKNNSVFMLVNDITEKRLSDYKHQEAEIRYRKLFEQSPDSVILIDPNTTKPIDFNMTAFKNLGYSMEEFANLAIEDYDFILSEEEIRKQINEVLLEKKLEFITKHKSKSGKIIDVMGSVQAIELYGSIYLLYIYRDITELKNTEKALKLSEEKFKSQYKNLPLPTFTWKKMKDSFILIDFNKSAEILTHGSVNKYLDVSSEKIFHKRPDIINYIERSYNEKTIISINGKYTFESGDKKLFIANFAFAPPDLVILHLIDITDIKKAEEEMRLLAKYSNENPDPILRVSKKGIILYANKSSEILLNACGCEIGGGVPDFIQHIVKIAYDTKETKELEVPIANLIFSFSIVPIHDTDFVYLYAKDITKKKQNEEYLRLASKVFTTSNEGIYITDDKGFIVDVNISFSKITGYTKEEVMLKEPSILSSGKHQKEFFDNFWKELNSKGTWKGEMWDKRKNGEVFPVYSSVSSVTNEKGEVTHYVCIFNDITKIKKTEQKLKDMAYYDSLTGIPNRSLLFDRLQQAIYHEEFKEKFLALIFLDLDRFKVINDTLGHIIGDKVLIAVANRLHSCIRKSDTLARYGGDEFAILLYDLKSKHRPAAIAERIISEFSKPFFLDKHEIYITISIGIALYPIDSNDLESLLKNADMAMYSAKNRGRNNYKFYSKELNTKALSQLRIETELKKALINNEFSLNYQPKVDIETGEIIGFEALLRWNNLKLGEVPPIEFIPLAEETGMIIPIGEWVLSNACKQNKKWIEEGYPSIKVAVNLSAKQLNQSDFVENVKNILVETGLKPENLELEITESAIMKNPDTVIQMLKEMKKLGVSLSIDDFGTGYSSLNYLKKFPIDSIKIDKSFVDDLEHSKDDASIIKATISLAHNLNLKVIAEGVENENQLKFLRKHKCDIIQGYYFSRPLFYEDISKFLLSRTGELKAKKQSIENRFNI